MLAPFCAKECPDKRKCAIIRTLCLDGTSFQITNQGKILYRYRDVFPFVKQQLDSCPKLSKQLFAGTYELTIDDMLEDCRTQELMLDAAMLGNQVASEFGKSEGGEPVLLIHDKNAVRTVLSRGVRVGLRGIPHIMPQAIVIVFSKSIGERIEVATMVFDLAVTPEIYTAIKSIENSGTVHVSYFTSMRGGGEAEVLSFSKLNIDVSVDKVMHNAKKFTW